MVLWLPGQVACWTSNSATLTTWKSSLCPAVVVPVADRDKDVAAGVAAAVMIEQAELIPLPGLTPCHTLRELECAPSQPIG